MFPLNLPAYEYKLKQSPEKTLIFDSIRRKYVVLTPEEWVRQHFIHYLTGHLHYPKGLISVERGMVYNTLVKRTDICVYDTNRQPLLLVECKAPDVAITPAVINQATTYNKTLKARLVVLSNGLEHYCWQVDFANNRLQILQHIPDYRQLVL